MPNALTFLLILCVTLSGCASVVSYPQQPSELRTCQALLEDYDTVVKRNGAYDAQDYPLPSFPYLRSDRFLAANDLKSLSQGGTGAHNSVGLAILYYFHSVRAARCLSYMGQGASTKSPEGTRPVIRKRYSPS